MRWSIPWSSIVLGAALLIACDDVQRSGDPDIQLRVRLDPDPPVIGMVVADVTVADVDWSPRNGDRVIVTWLRDSLPVLVDTAAGQGAGLYRVPQTTIPVAGDWTLKVRVEGRDGRWTEILRDTPVGVPSGGDSD